MKIIYIAPNPLKGSSHFTKSVTATLHHKNSTIKYKHIHSSCILMNQKKLKTKMGLEKVGVKVNFKVNTLFCVSNWR